MTMTRHRYARQDKRHHRGTIFRVDFLLDNESTHNETVALETSRRDLSIRAPLGACALLVVERFTMETRPRGCKRCVRTCPPATSYMRIEPSYVRRKRGVGGNGRATEEARSCARQYSLTMLAGRNQRGQALWQRGHPGDDALGRHEWKQLVAR